MTPTNNYADPIPNLGRDGWYREAWALFKQEPGLWVSASFVSGLISVAISGVLMVILAIPTGVSPASLMGHFTTTATPRSTPLSLVMQFVIDVVQFFVSCYLGAGLLKMAIASVRREPIKFDLIFSGMPATKQLALYNFVFWIISVVLFAIPAALLMPGMVSTPGTPPYGLIATFVIIGLVVSTLYLFILPGEALVADGVPAMEALRRSFAGATKNLGHVIGAYLFFVLLVILSICTCYIGLLVVYPVVTIVIALAARDIADLPAGRIDTSWPGAAYPGTAPSQPGAWPPAPSAGTWPPPPSAEPTPSEPDNTLVDLPPVPKSSTTDEPHGNIDQKDGDE